MRISATSCAARIAWARAIASARTGATCRRTSCCPARRGAIPGKVLLLHVAIVEAGIEQLLRVRRHPNGIVCMQNFLCGREIEGKKGEHKVNNNG